MQNIKELEERIQSARKAYYNGESIMSDAEYDALEDSLRRLNPDSWLLKEIGTSEDFGALKKIPVGVKMYSTDKALNLQEMESYWNRTLKAKDTEYIVSAKIDGLAISLEYENGAFIRAATRGNGLIGSDITDKVNRIPSIPKKLRKPFTGMIRGEAFMTFENFNKFLEVLETEGSAPQSNPRNSVSALLNAKVIQSASAKLSLVSFLVYGVYEKDADDFGSYQNYIDQLQRAVYVFGFEVVPYKIIYGKSNFVPEVFEKMIKELPYPCDGIVLRVGNQDMARSLGTAAKYLPAVTAYKFRPEEAVGVVREIVWSAGSREISPVVVLEEPVVLDGAQITRVAAHTVKNLIDTGAAPGQKVKIVRSGGVIPKLVPKSEAE